MPTPPRSRPCWRTRCVPCMTWSRAMLERAGRPTSTTSCGRRGVRRGRWPGASPARGVGRRPAGRGRGGRLGLADDRPRPPGRAAVRWGAHPARAGRADHPPAGLRAPRRADQPPRRRGDGVPGGLPQLGCPGVVVVASHDRVFLDGRVPASSTWTRALRDRRPRRQPVRGGFRDLSRAQGAGAAAWEQAYLAPAGRAERAPGGGPTRTARGARTTEAPGQRQVHLQLQGRATSNGPSAAGSTTSSGGSRSSKRDQIPKPPRPLDVPRGASRRGRQGGSVQVRDLLFEGRVRSTGSTSRRGEQLLVTGANGSGKSTLLQGSAGPAAADVGTCRR